MEAEEGEIITVTSYCSDGGTLTESITIEKNEDLEETEEGPAE